MVTLPEFASVIHVFTGERKVPSIRITSRDVRTYFCLLLSLKNQFPVGLKCNKNEREIG